MGRANYELIATMYRRLAGGGVPVNLRELCRRLGYSIVEWAATEGFTAALLEAQGIVAVNRAMSRERRRFSVAHEIGHRALGRAGIHFFGERGRAERAANGFAAALLMPADCAHHAWEEYAHEPRAWRLRLVADRFGVSAEAAKIRIEELDITN